VTLSKAAALLLVPLLALAASGAWGTYDHGLDCTKCLAHGDVVEERFLGFVFFRRTTFQPQPGDYERIFGYPCEHVFRTGGHGRESHSLLHGSTVGCGMTSAGLFVAPRLDAVGATYDAERRLGSTALAIETLGFIDGRLAPGAEVGSIGDKTWKTTAATLHGLADDLRRAATAGDWETALRAARAEAERTRPAISARPPRASA
jgi:hypothetical protein